MDWLHSSRVPKITVLLLQQRCNSGSPGESGKKFKIGVRVAKQ